MWSFEVGSKDRFLNNHLAVNGSVFYLDWQNVQQNLVLSNCGSSYVNNFGSATSKGFDLSVDANPFEKIRVGLNVGYMDSTLSGNLTGTKNTTTGVTPILALSRNALDLVPKWTGDLSFEWTHDLPWSGYGLIARADYQYQGDFNRTPGPGTTLYNPITYNGQAYSTVALRTGLEHASWRGTLFVNNLTNAHPTLFLATESGLTGFVN